MGILTGAEIRKRIQEGRIEITPFNEENLGANSYDVALGETVFRVISKQVRIDKRSETVEIGYFTDGCFLLRPGEFYLGVTKEFVAAYDSIPILEGRSSYARMGLEVHCSAGFGDIGFANHWTLEMTVKKEMLIKPGEKIAQIYFQQAVGSIDLQYTERKSSHYIEINKLPGISSIYKG